MLRDHVGGAPVLQPPGPSTVLCKPHARYSGVARGVRLRYAAHLQVPAGDVPAQIRRDGTRACPVDHGTGSRSQIRIDARSTVPWYMNSRLS